MLKAYAPYSKFPVGVAALVDDGRLISGANVENASYGIGLCAECSLVSALAMSGGGRLVAIVCVDGAGNFLAPCGRCRQLIFEHGGNEALLMTPNGPEKMSAMLPWAFGPENLN
jgi:cytidine deaminase